MSFQIWNDDKITTKWFTVILSSFEITAKLLQNDFTSMLKSEKWNKCYSVKFEITTKVLQNDLQHL